MTGPEHYRKAEELLDTLRAVTGGYVETSLLAEAQVHATLALAAATALADTPADWKARLVTASVASRTSDSEEANAS